MSASFAELPKSLYPSYFISVKETHPCLCLFLWEFVVFYTRVKGDFPAGGPGGTVRLEKLRMGGKICAKHGIIPSTDKGGAPQTEEGLSKAPGIISHPGTRGFSRLVSKQGRQVLRQSAGRR